MDHSSGLPLTMTFNDIQVEKAADDAVSTHWLDIAMVGGQLQLVDGDKTLSTTS